MKGVGLALVVSIGTVPALAFAQERITGYALQSVTLYDANARPLEKKNVRELPPIPAEGLTFERLKMGLVRVRLAGQVFILNHGQLNIVAPPPKGVTNGCNAVKTSTGGRSKPNIGIGLGGCK